MASGLTPIYNIPYPLATDPVDVHGDMEDLAKRTDNVLDIKANLLIPNTFTATNVFSVNSTNDAVRITQTGTGNAFKVEDSATPDLTPFVITNSGDVGIGTGTPGYKLHVIGTGYFSGAVTFDDTVTFNSTVIGLDLAVGEKITFEGETEDDFELTLSAGDPTADRLLLLPDADDTLVGKATTDTLTNKSISLSSNTLTGTITEFNTALSGDSFVTLTGTETLTNKSISLSNNTITGTLSEFNTALSGDNFVSLTGTETLTNKTLTSPSISDPTFTGQASGLELAPGEALVFEGTTANSFETTLNVEDPTADRTITLPDVSGTVITTGNENDLYPDQTGNDGFYLQTDGTNVLWSEVDALPDQTGNSGLFLTTDGDDAFWAEVIGGLEPSPTAPLDPSNGQGWFDTTNGKAYVFYEDGDSGQWVEVGNPGGYQTLASLSDTNIGTAVDGDTLLYDGATAKWVPGSQNIDEFKDVTITAPENNDILVYDAGSQKWENKPQEVSLGLVIALG
jgi:hypothetical protein